MMSHKEMLDALLSDDRDADTIFACAKALKNRRLADLKGYSVHDDLVRETADALVSFEAWIEISVCGTLTGEAGNEFCGTGANWVNDDLEFKEEGEEIDVPALCRYAVV
jgi:hypothetical protein